ncbi:SAV_2336 N-terminal domain-related protein [Streptomyces daliensis]
MPGRALRVFAEAGVPLSAEELLDVLWLASRLPSGARAPLARSLGIPVPGDGQEGDGDGADTGTAGGTDPAEATPRETHADEAPARKPAPSAPPLGSAGPHRAVGGAPRQAGALHATAGPGRREGRPSRPAPAPARPALPVRVPEDKALGGDGLIISRALRSLKQRHPTGHRGELELDEDATAAVMAETGIPDTVERPARERWLDLALLVDDGVSMLLWRRLATELRVLLQQLGAFRDIRVYGLDSRREGPPRLRSRPFSPAPATLSTASVADPSGRTLVLVVSDGIGGAWRDGRMYGVLARWAQHCPTAILHALPPHMWDSSGIRTGVWQVATPRRGAANTTWQVSDLYLPAELAAFDGVPVPVLEPEPEALSAWARQLSSPGASRPLPLWTPEEAPGARGGPVVPGTGAGTDTGSHLGHGAGAGSAPGRGARADGSVRAAEAVLRFRDAASPEAYRLAAHLAAVAPLSVPVMRLVRSAVPGRVGTAHLAEVFLGGLMRHTGTADSALPLPHQTFDFIEGAPEILLDTAPPIELLRTSRTVAERLRHLVGASPDFPAWLAHPGGTSAIQPGARPFAWLDDRLLAHLGAGPVAPAPAPAPARSPYALPLPPELDPLASWPALRPQDFQSAGPYTLRMRSDAAGKAVAYIGEDDTASRALIRVSRSSDWPTARELLSVEREALQRMDGSYAPALLDSDLRASPPWLALALPTTAAEDPAATLRAVTQAAGPLLDSVLFLRLGLFLARAVRTCHARGLVHGSLTPQDVLVTEDGVTIVNWSSACVDGVSSALPQAVPLDTPYRAPEVSYWPDSKTPAGDVYALGTILVAATTGRTWRHFQRDSLLLSAQFRRLPAALRETLADCIRTDPAARPSAHEVAEVFEAHLPEPLPDEYGPAREHRDGHVPPPPGPEEPGTNGHGERRQRLLAAVRAPLPSAKRITVLSPKDQMGSTTVAATLGAVLAQERRDRVLAIDTAAYSGAQIHLSRRVYRNTSAVFGDLVTSLDSVREYEDLRLFVSEQRSGLAVLANDDEHLARRPAPVRGDDYRRIVELAAAHYRIVLTDTDPQHLLTDTVDIADAAVIVVKADWIGLRDAARALDRLRELGRGSLAERTVVVLNRAASDDGDTEHARPLAGRCRGTVTIPYDRHLSVGSVVELDWLEPATYDAFLQLGALLLS